MPGGRGGARPPPGGGSRVQWPNEENKNPHKRETKSDCPFVCFSLLQRSVGLPGLPPAHTSVWKSPSDTSRFMHGGSQLAHCSSSFSRCLGGRELSVMALKVLQLVCCSSGLVTSCAGQRKEMRWGCNGARAPVPSGPGEKESSVLPPLACSPQAVIAGAVCLPGAGQLGPWDSL